MTPLQYYPQMSNNQRSYLSYVRNHPGCCVADVDRACRLNPAAGHMWVYAGVSRLIQQGALQAKFVGTRKRLWVTG